MTHCFLAHEIQGCGTQANEIWPWLSMYELSAKNQTRQEKNGTNYPSVFLTLYILITMYKKIIIHLYSALVLAKFGWKCLTSMFKLMDQK